MRDHRRKNGAAPGESKVTERPLVGESQVRSAVGESETNPDVGGNMTLWITQEKLPAHAEMREQGILGHRMPARRSRGHGQPEVLPPPGCSRDGEPAEGGGEVARARDMTPHGTRMQYLDITDGPAGHMALQPGAHDLDFRQFRHASFPGTVFRVARVPISRRPSGSLPSGRFGGRTCLRPAGPHVALAVADGTPGRLGRLLLGLLLGTALARSVHPATDPDHRTERLLVVRTAFVNVIFGHTQDAGGGEFLQ
jgi:hypothetical protein